MVYFKDHCQQVRSNMKIPTTLDLLQVFYVGYLESKDRLRISFVYP